MSAIADGLIRFYQRYISFREGFTCALLVRDGGLSCSEAVRRIIRRRGILNGLPEIGERYKACRGTAAALRDNPDLIPQQAIDCDFIGCDGCGNISAFDSCSGGGEGSGSGSRIGVIVLPVCLTAILLIVLWLGWGYARQVVAVEIRLLEAGSEYTDGRLSRILGGE